MKHTPGKLHRGTGHLRNVLFDEHERRVGSLNFDMAAMVGHPGITRAEQEANTERFLQLWNLFVDVDNPSLFVRQLEIFAALTAG